MINYISRVGVSDVVRLSVWTLKNFTICILIVYYVGKIRICKSVHFTFTYENIFEYVTGYTRNKDYRFLTFAMLSGGFPLLYLPNMM